MHTGGPTQRRNGSLCERPTGPGLLRDAACFVSPAILEVPLLTVLFVCPLAENTIDERMRDEADSSVPSGRFFKRPGME